MIEKQTEWLELARQQAQKLADSRSRFTPPLRWGVIARREGDRARRRLSWATALLSVVMLGAATGTWAFVTHLTRTGEPSPSVAPTVRPSGVAPTRRSVAPVPAPVKVEERAVPSEAPRPRPRRKVVKLTAAVPAAPTAPAETLEERPRATAPLSSSKPQRVIFGTSDAPADPAIIVSPRARMKPLWTVESYRKRGMRGSW